MVKIMVIETQITTSNYCWWEKIEKISLFYLVTQRRKKIIKWYRHQTTYENSIFHFG